MKNECLKLALVLGLSVGGTAYAQAPPENRPPERKSQTVSLTDRLELNFFSGYDFQPVTMLKGREKLEYAGLDLGLKLKFGLTPFIRGEISNVDYNTLGKRDFMISNYFLEPKETAVENGLGLKLPLKPSPSWTITPQIYCGSNSVLGAYCFGGVGINF